MNKYISQSELTDETDHPVNKQRIKNDLWIVVMSALLVYLIASYFDLAERYINWTALGELYQLDEAIFVLLASCVGLIWFSLRRIQELKHILRHNLNMQHNLRETNQHISQLLENNRAQVKHIALVRESERQHLASELHNVFGQHLAAMDANLTVALKLTMDTKLLDTLNSVMESTTHLRTITRDKLRNLKPPILKSIGLVGAVQELLNDWCQSFPDIVVKTQMNIDAGNLHDDVALTLYRAIQEGLLNIGRHGKANSVKLSLHDHTHQHIPCLRMTLDDDGYVNTKSAETGLGLMGVRERTEALDGVFVLTATPSAGTRMDIIIPKQPTG